MRVERGCGGCLEELIYTCTSKSVYCERSIHTILGDTAHHFMSGGKRSLSFVKRGIFGLCLSQKPMPIIPVALFFFSRKSPSTPVLFGELVMCASVRLRTSLIDHLACQYPN